MSATFMKVTGIANLGKDPEARYTNSGQPVTTFSAAATREYPNAAGEKVEETTWVRITVWGKLAETCAKYLKKGSRIYFEGRLVPGPNGSPRLFEKNDGTSGASFEITANEIRFLSPHGEANGDDAAVAEGSSEEDIPF